MSHTVEPSVQIDDEPIIPAMVVLDFRPYYQIPLPQALAFTLKSGQPLVVSWMRSYLEAERSDACCSNETAASRARALIEQIDATFHFSKISTVTSPGHVMIANEAKHDEFFEIERVSGSTQPALIRSILEAKARFDESMTRFYAESDQRLYDGIGIGLSAALAHLAGETPARLTDPDRPEAGRSTESPVRRWVVGHQIFAAVTQCIIVAMSSFETAMNADDVKAAGAALDLAATLLLASASAFRFTADFSPVAYSETVRPSMAPEQVGRGFSGLLSEDHRALVDLMVRTRPLMAAAAAALPDEHRRVRDALSYVYDDHKFVCARFGGGEGSSLRSDACSEVPGVVLLDRFKKARTRLLTPMAKGR